MSRPRPVVTIDGPAGAGKSTVSRMLAERLGFVYLDTGAIYRAVALEADAAGLGDAIDRSDSAAGATEAEVARLDAIAAIRPAGYVGTPSFLKILIEKGAELGKDISSIRKAFTTRSHLGSSYTLNIRRTSS